MVTRAVTGGRYQPDVNLRRPQSLEELAYLARLEQDGADRLMPLAANEVYYAHPS